MQSIEQTPAPETMLVRYRGDLLAFSMKLSEPCEGQASLRTNVGSAAVQRREIIERAERGRPLLARDWHDIPMRRISPNEFHVALPLLEVGQFDAKTFFLPAGTSDPLWPQGGNVRIKVEPADYSACASIYNAFVRQFTPPRPPLPPPVQAAIAPLEAGGFSVIPQSGTFRNLMRQLDFIMGKLRFRIVLLLPIHPPPTTYARMGRFGSPYAVLDFMDVDPALAEFDRRTTPLDQFRELANAIHERSGRLFIDIPINHTGWASWLQIHHPNWFVRNEDRSFQSPGAWGVTWEDLSKLDYRRHDLWHYMADVFLYWCRQGVDGFRCDAGYMVPVPVWQYIVAKVRQQFPDTVFLLEGLGGPFQTMEQLLSSANLNWAYSELFQTHGQHPVESYLPGVFGFAASRGPMVHFAETHDNSRLATVSPVYARFRTALTALCSQQGAFGIANGVEWLATQRIDVHDAPPLNWDAAENQVEHVARLNAILEAHPAFTAGAPLRLIHTGHYGTFALHRTAPDGGRPLLVVANFNDGRPAIVVWSRQDFDPPGDTLHDLVSRREIRIERNENNVSALVDPYECLCLTADPDEVRAVDAVLRGAPGVAPPYRVQVLRAEALKIYAACRPDADFASLDATALGAALTRDPLRFIAETAGDRAPPVTVWRWPADLSRTVMVPPHDFLLLFAPHPFRARIVADDKVLAQIWSMPGEQVGHFGVLGPLEPPARHAHRALHLTVLEPGKSRSEEAPLLCLARGELARVRSVFAGEEVARAGAYAVCGNGRGAMSQMRGAWGELRSQYDALLAANLHPSYPVDHHVMLTRFRAWVLFRGYSTELNQDCLDAFWVDGSDCVVWRFTAPCGVGRIVPIQIALSMEQGANRIVLRVARLAAAGNDACLAAGDAVRIVLRPDLEDRNCHTTTKAYLGPESAWPYAVQPLDGGFVFAPVPDRRLRVTASKGAFTPEPQWNYMVSLPFEAERGLNGSTDLFSPGFFALPLLEGDTAKLTAEVDGSAQLAVPAQPGEDQAVGGEPAGLGSWPVPEAASRAIGQFIVARDECLTVLAGFPWFLDWGRDTMICLRGIVADGRIAEARKIVLEFARFEVDGTLPNVIRGNDVSNRDTSDAPLWFFVAVADLLAAEHSDALLDLECGGRTLRQVLRSIGENYMRGTPNGIAMDAESGLIFSPMHFTWMDTNHPAGTPRQGYPIEIQALWHAALSLLSRVDPDPRWVELAGRVRASIVRLYAHPGRPYLSDCLHAERWQKAADARADDALRPNQLLAISLGAVTDRALGESILAACQELLVPGAIRSLADRPVATPMPVAHNGNLLNDPYRPYWGHYRGDEDTRRKPAYHNGTAWTWIFPAYCEAMVLVYGPSARDRARAILSSATDLFNRGCIGHVPEIVDGNAPHEQRGCGAQAWGATELLRVWKLLG